MTFYSKNILKISYKSIYLQIPTDDVDSIDFVRDVLQFFMRKLVSEKIQFLVRKSFHRDVKP